MGLRDWLRGRAQAPAQAAVASTAASVPPRSVSATSAQPGASDGRFLTCLAVVLRHEGGFVNDPQDPGGATNLGITAATLASWRGAPVTAEAVRALTGDEAAAIYRARYWQPMRCDHLPAGVDLVVFDFAVNAGPGRATRMLQMALAVPADGVIGPITLRAAAAAEPRPLIDRMSQWRNTYYRALPTFARFGRGWLRRTEDVRQQARRMTGVG